MASPHDSLFCQVFSDPRHAAGELRALLPAAIEGLVAWDTLQRRPSTYKDAAFGDQHADLLFGVEIAGRPALLYLLLEHKSAGDRWTGFQLLRYMIRILEQHRREHPEARRLPPIVAMVVHHGVRGWEHGTELIELFDLDAETRRLLAPYLPKLRFLVDDLARATPEELAARAQTALAHLVLACLQRLGAGADLAQVMRELREVFRAACAASDSGALLSAVLSYVAKVRDVPRDELCGIIRVELGPELEDVMTSTYDQVLNEGVARGKAETLLKLLGKRFGEPSAEIAARVQAADVETLDRWLLRFVDASALDEVFADD